MASRSVNGTFWARFSRHRPSRSAEPQRRTARSECALCAHTVERREVFARVSDDLLVARVVRGLDGDDEFCERRVLFAEIGDEFVFGLRGP